MDLKVGYVCDRGSNPKRPINEDCYLVIPERGLFAVFDGVGGGQAGEIASQTASETIKESLAHGAANSSADLIRRTIELANRDIYELAESNPSYRKMATTVALVKLDDHRAIIAHVGDSRVYRFENGRLHRETIDHTDVDDQLRAGLITPEEAARRADRNIINRALGIQPEVEVEIKTIPIGEGTRFLLCTDGISRHLSDEELARVLGRVADPQLAANELKRLVYWRGAEDNFTAIVVQVGGTARSANSSEREQSANSEIGAARRARIEVDFSGARQLRGRPPEAPQSVKLHRRAIYFLLAMVLVALAFYAGLRASDYLAVCNTYRERAAKQSALGDKNDPLEAARAQFDRGQYQSAAAALASILQREPKNAEAYYLLGRVQLEQHQYSQAANSFEQAATVEPKMYEAMLEAAAAYEAAGNKAKAIEALAHYNEQRLKAERRSANAQQ
jgi:serine/threonine protein phosphatase PrpC